MRYAPKKVFILENSVQFLSFRLCYRFLALFSNLIFFYLLGLVYLVLLRNFSAFKSGFVFVFGLRLLVQFDYP